MVLNLERQASNNPVLNLDAVAPRIELRLNGFATTPSLEIQVFQWPESSGIQNIPIPWRELKIVALIAAALGLIWVSNQMWDKYKIERKLDKTIVQNEPTGKQNYPPQSASHTTPTAETKAIIAQFSPKDSEGWAKKNDRDMWVRPAPPYNGPPNNLEVRGQSLLYLGEQSNFKVLKRLPVYKSTDTDSPIDHYMEPGQIGRIVEGYEKTIRPATIHLLKKWQDPGTGVTYKAGENIYTYASEEGCFWLMYSSTTNGQLAEGVCPPDGEDTASVDYGKSIYYFKIKSLAFGINDGWIKPTDGFWGNTIEEVIEEDNSKPEISPSSNDRAKEDNNLPKPSEPQPNEQAVVGTETFKSESANNEATQLVTELLDYAAKKEGHQHETEILKLKQSISDLPKPAKGDRKSARAINEKGLSLFNNGEVSESIELFKQASQLDKSDPEILNNLGYALLKHGKLVDAKTALLDALAISPGRAPAWQNLADILTIQGDRLRGVAAYKNVFRFSKNRAKTYAFMDKLNLSDVSAMKDARQQAMNWAEKTYVDENFQSVAQPLSQSPLPIPKMVSESGDNATEATSKTLSGTWQGIVTQIGYGKYQAIMSFNEANGTMEYPSLNCGGTIIMTSQNGHEYQFKEHITYGRCVDGGIITVKAEEDVMEWNWQGHGDKCIGTLTRQP